MNIWNFILNKLNNNKEVVLLTIINSNGSSPGRQGFKMATSDDDELNGSVGGGVVEYNLVEQAKKLLKSEKKQPFVKGSRYSASHRSITNSSGRFKNSCSFELLIMKLSAE